MLKKYRYFLLIVTSIAIALFLYKNCNGKANPIPIAYDKQYVEELYDFEDQDTKVFFKKYNIVFKKVDRLEDDLAKVYNLSGENGIGWDTDPGDFKRVKIKLKNGHEVVYDNSDGGWLDINKKGNYGLKSISEVVKIPEKAKRIKKHPYGITLAMEGEDQLLILFGYHYSSDPAGLLTLIYLAQDRAEVIFNERIKLFEIIETEKGYLLKGQVNSGEFINWEDSGVYTSYPGQGCEILIENNQLSFHELPEFDKNRLKLPIKFDKKQIVTLQNRKMPVDKEGEVPERKKVGMIEVLSAELSNYEGEYWYYDDRNKRWDATPGDFCQISFTLPSGVWVMIQNKEGGWIKPNDQIKLLQSTKIRKHEYGIILDIGRGNHVLALTGYKYSDAPSFLTLICVTPDNADIVFNKKVDLLEIQEMSEGYRLIGETMEQAGDEIKRQPCEISIERGELVFKAL